LWARKESVIKARGLGSYVAVADIDVLDHEVEGGWLCIDVELGKSPDYRAAVTVHREPGVAVTTFDFDWD
jgi:phosphopantetheinyl transferase